MADTGWALHQRRAGHLLRDLADSGLRVRTYISTDTPIAKGWAWEVLAQHPDVICSAVLLLARQGAERGLPIAIEWELPRLLRAPYRASLAEARLAAEVALAAGGGGNNAWAFHVTTAMLERAGEPLDSETQALVEQMVARIERDQSMPADERRKIRAALVRHLPHRGTGINSSMLALVDGWAMAVLARLEAGAGADAPAVSALLEHLGRATGSKPGKGWAARSAELLQQPAARDALLMLLSELAEAEGIDVPDRWGLEEIWTIVVDEANADVARAALWASVTLPADSVAPLLQRTAQRASTGREGHLAEKVANAAILALGVVATADTIAALQGLLDATRDNGVRKRIKAALASAAAVHGLTPGQPRNPPSQPTDWMPPAPAPWRSAMASPR